MGQQYGAAQPIIDLAKSWSDKASDLENLGPIKRLIGSVPAAQQKKTTTKPLATSWAYYGKPQPRPSDQKQTPTKPAPKKISGRKN